MGDGVTEPLGSLPALTQMQELWRRLRWLAPLLIAAALALSRPAVPGLAPRGTALVVGLLLLAPPLVNLVTGPPGAPADEHGAGRHQLAALAADAVVVVALVALFVLADPRSDAFALLLLPQLQMATTRRSGVMVLTAALTGAALIAVELRAAMLHGLGAVWPLIWGRLALLAFAAVVLANMARLLDRHIQALRTLHRDVAHRALHDGLTGLPNRALFFERVDLALARQRRSGNPFAVVFVDLDDLKAVNDSRGHAVGDELLQITAARLRDELRVTDTPARLGGDEFAALLDGPGGDAHVEDVTRRLLARLSEPISTPTLDLRPSVSIGVAGSEDLTSAQELVKRADTAMYRAKARGKGRVVRFAVDDPDDPRAPDDARPADGPRDADARGPERR
ncbi:MAG TPA: GGDEF domain-containing protein [Euzebyales bacterium]|nr:GGDEF domain-containing protein [Euzebyales bacterium]